MNTLKATLILAIVAITGSSAHAALRHQWALNEASGTTVVDSIAGLNGVIAGPGATRVAGVEGGGVDIFDGGLNLPNIDTTGYGGLTIEMWVNQDIANSAHSLFRGDEWLIIEHTAYAGGPQGHGMRWLGMGNGAMYPFLGTDLNAGWQHVVATVDGSTKELIIYLDGVAGGTTGTVPNAILDSGNWGIGHCGHDTNCQPVDGQIDLISVFDVVLTPAQILDRYNNPSIPIPEPATLAMLGMGGLLTLSRRRRAA